MTPARPRTKLSPISISPDKAIPLLPFAQADNGPRVRRYMVTPDTMLQPQFRANPGKAARRARIPRLVEGLRRPAANDRLVQRRGVGFRIRTMDLKSGGGPEQSRLGMVDRFDRDCRHHRYEASLGR